MRYADRTAPLTVKLPLTSGEQAANCHRLADFLDTVPENQFYMGTYTHGPDCGTTACAMGWAVLSGVIPGLSWARHEGIDYRFPVLNGKESDFIRAGEALFGEQVTTNVFRLHQAWAHDSADDVARMLRRYARSMS